MPNVSLSGSFPALEKTVRSSAGVEASKLLRPCGRLLVRSGINGSALSKPEQDFTESGLSAVAAAIDEGQKTDLFICDASGTLSHDYTVLLGADAIRPNALVIRAECLLSLGCFLPHEIDLSFRKFVLKTVTANLPFTRLAVPLTDGLPAVADSQHDLAARIAQSFPELRFSAQELTLLCDPMLGGADAAPALQRLVARHRSLKLNVAIAQVMRKRDLPLDVQVVFGGTDWSAPARVSGTASHQSTRPLFTVLIATFNAAEHLPDTLKSIRDQGRDDVECIIIDGGSRDTTLAVAAAWPDVVTEVISQKDRGLYDALNKGIAVARGHLIGIVGAGDCYLPGGLKTVADAYFNNPTDVYGGQTIERAADGTLRKRKDEPWGRNSFVSGGPVGHNGLFATREIYDDIGHFGLLYPMAEDTRWVHRAIQAGRTFTYIAHPIVLFPLTGMSSRNPDLLWQEAHGLIKQNFPQISLEREDALKLLFAARGWCEPEEIKGILEAYNNVPLNISAALALRAQNVAVERMLDIFGGHMWDCLETLYEKNGLRFFQRDESATPFLSFVLPSYNVGNYLAKALDSILQQDVDDIEVIVVDDGSTDHTAAIARTYAAFDSRVRVVTQPNQGLSQARLSGLPECRGDYIWFVDSDDFLLAGSLGRIVQVLKDSRPDAYKINFAFIDESGAVSHAPVVDPYYTGFIHHPARSEVIFAALAYWNAQAWRFIVRRDVLIDNDLTFPVGYYYEDHQFALHLVSRVETIFVDAAVSYLYLRRSGSISSVRSRRVFEFLHIRRLCLDFLRSEGLLERMITLSISYLMPATFIDGLVDEQFKAEFVANVLDDLDDLERSVLLHNAGASVLRIIEKHAPLWFETLAPEELAGWNLLREFNERGFLPDPAPTPALHPLSATVKPHHVSGLYSIEDGSSLPGAPPRFAWNVGNKFVFRLDTSKLVSPRLHLRFRNLNADQILVIETDNFIQSVPCMSASLSVGQSFSVPLAGGKPGVFVSVRTAKVMKVDSRVSGIIVESFDLVESNLIEQLPAPKIFDAPRIVGSKGSNYAQASVEVRGAVENRCYVRIGKRCNVAGTFVFERGVGRISIGDGTSIESGCLFKCAGTDGIHIGKNTLISWNVTIMDTNAHAIDRALRENDATDWLDGEMVGRLGSFKNWYDVAVAPVTIGDGVWVGFGSTILKGVTIGDGAVIAAHSVITENVAPYSVVGGNPARLVQSGAEREAIERERLSSRFPELPLPTVILDH